MKFISKSQGLNVIIKPAFHTFNNFGQKQYVAGKSAHFVQGKFETQDQEIIDGLLKSASYGVEFVSAEPKIPTVMPEAAEARVQEEKVIEEEMPYNCPICGRRSSNKAGLKSHMRSHEVKV
jgi:hypothetical protein